LVLQIALACDFLKQMEECELAEIEKGLKLQQEGRFRDAEVAYRAALKLNPNNADALHLLGTLAFQVGKYEIAVQRKRCAKHPVVF
jgi:Flp pilus assembly protein TadD